MSRYDLAAIVLAASAALGLVWFAFTRNGHRLAYVTAVAVYDFLFPATGTHVREKKEPGTVRAVLRDIALAAAWHMPRYWWWRDRLASAVRGCLHWPAGEMPRRGILRVPAAATAPGEGTAPATPAPGAVPLPPGGKLYPYRDGTPIRADRYSLRVPTYYTDPAEPVGAATGDFPRLIP